MRFEPIAIVGRACVLPGALSPEELWSAVVAGKDLVSSAPEGRWGMPKAEALCSPDEDTTDKAWSDRGGYVRGFENVWKPDGFGMAPESLTGVDEGVRWALHCAREALRDAGDSRVGAVDRSRVSAIYGLLGFPTAEMSAYAEAYWMGAERPDPRNRFMAAGSVATMRSALGLSGASFAIDTACASSLFAIKLACDQLHDGSVDMALAGAVNRSDDLFIHVGFTALKALSKSGQSRPFHADADGLLPAEGAGFVALKRLSDARRDGNKIYGVIRGVGLSNDGRGRGFLAPLESGQARAIRQAYEVSGVSPSQVSLLECHATGTSVGDATELKSTGELYQGLSGVPMGSLKSNMGHLITAAGVAGLIKVLEAMRHQTRPPTLHASKENPALQSSPFRLVHKAERWESNGPRVAGVSAFGFGGNNAHLLVSEDSPDLGEFGTGRSVPHSADELVVVALGSVIGNKPDALSAAQALAKNEAVHQETGTVEMALAGLKFPPTDLKETIPQQLTILNAARQALTQTEVDPLRTGVFLGTEPDNEVCRYGLRWRLPNWLRRLGLNPAEHQSWIERNKDLVVPRLTSAGVVGTMPNIPANRLNNQFDLGGQSFTVFGGPASGQIALHLAARAIESGELDAALVGAVDMCADQVHRRAQTDLERGPGEGQLVEGADAAVMLVIKRASDAQRAGDTILGRLSLSGPSFPQLGANHAAQGLRDLALGYAQGLKTHYQPEGPTLSFPGHNHVKIEPLPSGVAARQTMSDIQKMAPAPSLPKTDWVEPGNSGANVGSVHVPVNPVPVNAGPLRVGTNVVPTQNLELLRNSLSEIGQMQQRFLAEQSALFQQFMAVQSQGMALLHAAQNGEHAPVSVSSPPMNSSSLSLRSESQRTESPRVHSIPSSAPQEPLTPQPSLTPPSAPQAPKSGVGHESQRAESPSVHSTPAPQVVSKPQPPLAPQAPKKAVGKETQRAESPRVEVQASHGIKFDEWREPIGPNWGFEELKIHASGKISEIYGDIFKVQDDFHRQVRMPEPPLLLADRVTGMDAEPGSMKTGTIWSETDLRPDAWYLHEGHVPPGIMIESGQADLMLISYLGVDFTNKSERIYRLLGCELTYFGGMPKAGDTMEYQIVLDGHAKQGGTRLMFFHYDCRVDGEVRLAVRKGQAGFFTDEELANSEGCLWKPETQELKADATVDAPFAMCTRESFDADQIRAFADGRPWDCFGEGFEVSKTHTRTPRIQDGKMLFHDNIEIKIPGREAQAGPWNRGYLKSTWEVDPDHWFFDGHFKNDPCMPGTLMFDGCLQAMAFYMAAQGITLERDGWRFELVPEIPYQLSCRGQVTPQAKVLTYEIFVEEFVAGPIPTIYADLLCTVDGLKAFHARRVGLQLIPSWPLDEGSKLLEGYVEKEGVATANGFPFDYRSMLACANGRPSEAFGPIYDRFDSHIRVARLPNPPYHFVTRVSRLEGEIGSMQKGMEVDIEYDIPADAWYFDENGCRNMPFAVLLEAALQPCGWLASYLGCALTVDRELFFRNLDGTGTLHVDLLPDAGTMVTKVKSTNISKTGPMIIVGFEVECLIGDTLVYDLKTVFGFFPAEALQNQIGLPTTDEQRALLNAEPLNSVNLKDRPKGYWENARPKLAEPMLLMIDRVAYFDPKGGPAGLGALRAEKDVDPGEWFFKAHFFQDPVQPGSLGIEAMIQLLQFYMLETGMDEGIENPRFETLSHAHEMTWKYRGQVIPKNKLIQTTIEITETGRDEDGVYAVCNASLWVDSKRIYEAFNMGMRIVSGGGGERRTLTLDPAKDTWLNDHCPTYTLPALPMMSMVDLLAQGACTADQVTRLEDVRIKGWLTLDGAKKVWTERSGEQVRLLAAGSDGPREVASARVITGEFTARPVPLKPLKGEKISGQEVYQSGNLFHGPAFQILQDMVRTAEGATSWLSAAGPADMQGRVNGLLLDGATHSIPHDNLQIWGDKYEADKVAYPALIPEIRFFGPTPTSGTIRCEVRPDGFMGSPDFPAFKVQLIDESGVWCQMRLVEACFPKGTLGSADPADRQRFLRDREYVEGVRISSAQGEDTFVTEADIKAVDWFPGTVDAVYGLKNSSSALTKVQQIGIKEHIAAAHKIHPGVLPDALPLTKFKLEARQSGSEVTVKGDPNGKLDIKSVREFWTQWFDRDPWPVEDLYYGLIERFVRRIIVTDPKALEAIKGQSTLFLANHQIGVESLLFSVIASGLTEVPTVTLAKIEHKYTWLGKLIDLCFRYPEVRDPKVITFFDREDKASLPAIINELAVEMAGPGRSVMVHIEGTRSLECRTPVQKMSGAFIDMALGVNAPIVPVRFVGGLPVDPLEKRIEFPIGMGKQDIYFGRPIMPEELSKLHYGARKELVVSSINELGPPNSIEEPITGDPDFAAKVDAWMDSHPGVLHEHATLREMLAELAQPGEEVARLLAAKSAEDIDASTPKGAWLREFAEQLIGKKA